METDSNINNDFPMAEILVRLPLRTIAKFKSVCKRWKLLIESAIFQSLFVSLHKRSSCSWSLLSNDYGHYITKEFIGVYGCKRWGLPRPLSSYILSPPDLNTEFDLRSFQIRASASGLLLIRILDSIYYVGNPVLRKWVKIRPCILSLKKYFCSPMCGLVTNIKNDVVIGYKVVLGYTNFKKATIISFQVYSSETGNWTQEDIHCPCPIWTGWGSPHPISLNGILYWVEPGDNESDDSGGIIVIDLYNGGANRCRVILFPEKKKYFSLRYEPKVWHRRACSTSGGFIIYFDAISIHEDHKLKVWKLNNLERWELSWEINLAIVEFGISSIPIAMHPFDTDILYLMSRVRKCIMFINLRTKESMLLKDSDHHSDDSFSINNFKCPNMLSYNGTEFYLYQQFVPSPWIDDLPCPPPCAHCGRP